MPGQPTISASFANGSASGGFEGVDLERLSHAVPSEEALLWLRGLLSVFDTHRASGPAPAAARAATPVAAVELHDGRYQGGTPDLFVDLRIDTAGSGVISADFYRLGAGDRTYVASARTAPGRRTGAAPGRFEVVGQDSLRAVATGALSLSRDPNVSADVLNATFVFESALHGLPSRAPIGLSLARRADTLRTLGLEIEREADVAPIAPYRFEGSDVTIESALRGAGIEVIEAGQRSTIPKPPAGWGMEQLHALMERYAQVQLTTATWDLHLLLLSRSSRSGLFGVMYDTTETLPRQGAAVFADEIRHWFPEDFDRKLLQTTVHELGHALNLAHRFERAVGRMDSSSFMNYDWRYGGGQRQGEFWSRFRFSFDPDELEFLRHGPHPAVIPGGDAFHSINYWADGNGGYSPYVPEAPLAGFDLAIRPPIGGPVFEYAQPIFLEIELTNRTGRPVDLPPHLLDPKAGLLEVLIRRRTSGPPNDLAGAKSFVPILQRCFQPDPSLLDAVPDGGGLKSNLNLTYGSGGFAFAEPGEYEVTCLLVVNDDQRQRELIARSNTLRIRVGVPRSRDEDEDAMVMLRDDVGLYLALGGSDSLRAARDSLDGVADRRQGKKKTVEDPIVANILRCAGIDAGRWRLTAKGRELEVVNGDAATAAGFLESLGDSALRAFDATTARTTRELARKHRARAKGHGKTR